MQPEPAAIAVRSLRLCHPSRRRLCSRHHAGPKFHWFGYYDKRQFDPSGRYVLGMEVGFEHRSPRPDDAVQLGMVDLRRNDLWIPLAQTRAWNW
ncbi:MAG: hypothetical protein ACPL88_09105, partial [Bryobacteraceae bacterium]